GIRADQVAGDSVQDRVSAADADAVERVAGDHVGAASQVGRVAVEADEVLPRAAIEADAVLYVGQRLVPGGVDADVVAGYDVLASRNAYAVELVPGDDVALLRVGDAVAVGADAVVAALDVDPVALVGDRRVPGLVRPDAVAGDHVLVGVEVDALALV